MHNLKPINIPTLSPDDLIDIYTGVDGWENRQHEYYYRQANYGEHIWLKSKLVAAALSLADHVSAEGEESVFFALDNEPSQLTLAILNELKSDVERRGPPFSWSRSYRN